MKNMVCGACAITFLFLGCQLGAVDGAGSVRLGGRFARTVRDMARRPNPKAVWLNLKRVLDSVRDDFSGAQLSAPEIQNQPVGLRTPFLKVKELYGRTAEAVKKFIQNQLDRGYREFTKREIKRFLKKAWVPALVAGGALLAWYLLFRYSVKVQRAQFKEDLVQLLAEKKVVPAAGSSVCLVQPVNV